VIHDNFTYVQYLAKSFFPKKAPALLLKLDVAKAFDSLLWAFLLEVLDAKVLGGSGAIGSPPSLQRHQRGYSSMGN
jgi:hypothetical protein